jgi:hypothetical protein
MPRIARDAVDRAAIDGADVIEVPGAHARPPVLVPRDEMALALRLHEASYAKHVAPQVASGRIDETAIKTIVAQVCRALDEGPLSTSDIRTRVTHPDAGEWLTGALVLLSIRGVIRRYPVDGRLDSSKYAYELRHPDDRPDVDAEGDAAAIALKATRLYLRRNGPVSVGEIAEPTFLTKGTVRKALAALQAERIAVPGWTDDAWLMPDDFEAWTTFEPAEQHVVLLPYRDPFVSVRRPQAVLASRDTSPVLNTMLRPVPIRDVTVLHHHVVVAGGEIVGVWEYDGKTDRIATRLWSTDKGLRRRVADAASSTERFIRQQLGDAGLSAVDPPARRAKRIAFCRRQG